MTTLTRIEDCYIDQLHKGDIIWKSNKKKIYFRIIEINDKATVTVKALTTIEIILEVWIPRYWYNVKKKISKIYNHVCNYLIEKLE